MTRTRVAKATTAATLPTGCPSTTFAVLSPTVRLLYIALAIALMAEAPVRADECALSADGTLCADDLDPCTSDTCASLVCTHTSVPDRLTCDPIADAYRRTLGLGDILAELAALLATPPLPDAARVVVTDALDGTASDLARASAALAGRLEIPPPAAGETLAQARSRAAFGIARAAPPRVKAVLKVLRTPEARVAIGAATALDLARRARFLYRGTNQLKRELRRLQRVSGVFTR